jgi:hypothetical protein
LSVCKCWGVDELNSEALKLGFFRPGGTCSNLLGEIVIQEVWKGARESKEDGKLKIPGLRWWPCGWVRLNSTESSN